MNEVISIKGFELKPTGVRIPPGTTKQQWVFLAHRVTRAGLGYWWWVGDLSHYAMHHLEKSDEAIEELSNATGFGIKQLRLIGHCSKVYAVRDRIAGLPITHHLAVMHLPRGQRQALLHKAFKESWPVRKLRTMFTPKEKRHILYTLRVPISISKKPTFLKYLDDFCKHYRIVYYIQGTAIRQSRHRGMAMISTGT